MAIEKHHISPRQKMINLIYVVLMAMLGINVSPEELDEYELVQHSLENAIENSKEENLSLYKDLHKQFQMNPTKVTAEYNKADILRKESDSLYNYIEILKHDIAKESESVMNSADPVNTVLFNPLSGKGADLHKSIINYKTNVLSLINKKNKSSLLNKILSTESTGLTSWESNLFEDKPVIVAKAMLTKLQLDIRYAESIILHELTDNIDREDIRVNELSAFVVPESNTVIRGNSYKANIILAAIDTTTEPSVFLQKGTGVENIYKLDDSVFEKYCNRTGNFTLNGFVLTKNKEGKTIRCNFSQPYSVIEPSATVSADLTNVLYIGYDNPVSVSVPGAKNDDIYASIDGGTIREIAKGKYIARPSGTSQKATIKVFMKTKGKDQLMAAYDFKVRKLPEPTLYLSVGSNRFHSGRITRQDLLNAGKLNASIDDGILDVDFRVTGFDMVAYDGIGNAIPTNSEGAAFSVAQKNAIRNMQRGQRFFITRVNAVGPDNVECRVNASMEVIIK